MKLHEIFLTPDQLKYKDTNKNILSKWDELGHKSDERQKIGQGFYADAYSSEKDPGCIDKVARPSEVRSLSNDAYYQFLDMIAHNDRIASNPFFPKIYKLETYRGNTDVGQRYTYQVNMEKLAPLTSLSTEEILRIGRELFSDYDIVFKKERNRYEVRGTKPSGNISKDNEQKIKFDYAYHRIAILALAQCFDNAIQTDVSRSNNITNSYLNKAILLIRKILKSNPSFLPDLHGGNLMVRRGPFAPQIVITDPVSGGGAVSNVKMNQNRESGTSA